MAAETPLEQARARLRQSLATSGSVDNENYEVPNPRLTVYQARALLAATTPEQQIAECGGLSGHLIVESRSVQRRKAIQRGEPMPTFTSEPARLSAEADSIGLSIDMLDADRLRQYAQNLLTYGPDITHWASVPHVVSRLQILATNIEQAVRDIGKLRALAAPPQGTDPSQE